MNNIFQQLNLRHCVACQVITRLLLVRFTNFKHYSEANKLLYQIPDSVDAKKST